ncbi:MAG: prepilin-type N-terminal cleavage/methylation domain-containing protein [Candidatus Sumerlaeia bacterium]|nr:prepilin-type N-terminal cleavage/methylation domain-containing protein [Candidatus Sumerlaeia bacterium]
MKRRDGAFTLIELLIVVAIIAILAAIAVPNFLAAQTRSKVSRVKADLRTIATGLESYFTDYNRYVNDSDNTLGKNGAGGLALLTSPIAYLTTLPEDPFQSAVSAEQASDPNSRFAKNFALGSGSDNQGWRGRFGNYGSQGVPVQQSWLLISVGTDVAPADQADDTQGSDEWPYGGGGGARLLTYDPSNGTISDGDIYRAGGSLNVGNYFVNGQRFGRIND